jgi:2-dehydropantoate 2-reductase
MIHHHGAGAIGASGRLFAQIRCRLIRRRAHLEAIKRRPTLRRRRETRSPCPPPPSEIAFTPDDADPDDKDPDTERALADLETSGGARLAVFCAQNGVENERLAARRFERVYGMLVAMPATFLTPGEVVVEGTPLTGVLHTGRYPAGVDELAERVAADISASHMLSEPGPAVMRLKYSKLLANLGNGLQVITGSRWGNEDFSAAMRAVRGEALACYQAACIDRATEDEYRQRANSHFRMGEVAGQPRGGSSTWQSLMRGHTTIEVDYLNGEIVLLGALHGVAVPYNAVIRRVATRMAADGQKPGHYSFADLQAMVEAERRTQRLATA